jgi:hypothetical protein
MKTFVYPPERFGAEAHYTFELEFDPGIRPLGAACCLYTRLNKFRFTLCYCDLWLNVLIEIY